MAIKLKPLKDQVIVITGASSGIGLATALSAAEEGAKVVLAARNEEALQEIEQRINLSGGSATYVVADVGIKEDVEDIAKAAINEFGRIDTWVNDAGVAIYGKLEEVKDEDSRKLFETNFWGVVNGSLTALKHLKQSGGALINVGSVVSDVAVPIQGMYSASKHAVKGFTDALRIELEMDKAPVSVTLIKPSGINTPYPEHARNYTDKEVKLPPPVYDPKEVAYAILHAAQNPIRDVFVGGGGKMMSSTNKYAPKLMDKLSGKFIAKEELMDEPSQHFEGTLYDPGEGGRIDGNYPGMVRSTSYYTRASLSSVLTSALLAAAGLTALALIGKNSLADVAKETMETVKEKV
ncbi:MAG TPA: SDR family oxidoreductase [Cytophagales bacterium]|nr:SDR family oxidoreductase [Cytophagales bacterium]